MLTFDRQTFPASEITQRYHEDFYRFRNRDGYTGYHIGEDQRIYREEFIAALDLFSYYDDDYYDYNGELADDSSMLSYINIRPDEIPSNDYLNDPVFIQRFSDYSDAIGTATHSSDESYYTAASPITDSNDSAANNGIIRRCIDFILSLIMFFLSMMYHFLFPHNYEDVIVESIIDSYSSNDDNYSGNSSSTGYNSYSEEEVYDSSSVGSDSYSEEDSGYYDDNESMESSNDEYF
ncbi:hypothetical protein BD770DRAFT_408166 [Pilaira anomala]|nr:hypothetical protein BD770DRAFT_408166 [Pilaira anomala]